MRDAFGGAFSIKLKLIFLMLYISFMCVVINYARAFRVKNEIINIVEQNQGYDPTNKIEVDKQINNYLEEVGYHVNQKDVNRSSCSELTGHGYCIVLMSSDPEYYKVEAYMVFRLPIINVDFTIPIQGETRRLEELF